MTQYTIPPKTTAMRRFTQIAIGGALLAGLALLVWWYWAGISSLLFVGLLVVFVLVLLSSSALAAGAVGGVRRLPWMPKNARRAEAILLLLLAAAEAFYLRQRHSLPTGVIGMALIMFSVAVVRVVLNEKEPGTFWLRLMMWVMPLVPFASAAAQTFLGSAYAPKLAARPLPCWSTGQLSALWPLFDSFGNPRYSYDEDHDGRIILYPIGGHDPVTNATLHKIDAQIVSRLQAQVAKSERERTARLATFTPVLSDLARRSVTAQENGVPALAPVEWAHSIDARRSAEAAIQAISTGMEPSQEITQFDQADQALRDAGRWLDGACDAAARQRSRATISACKQQLDNAAAGIDWDEMNRMAAVPSSQYRADLKAAELQENRLIALRPGSREYQECEEAVRAAYSNALEQLSTAKQSLRVLLDTQAAALSNVAAARQSLAGALTSASVQHLSDVVPELWNATAGKRSVAEAADARLQSLQPSDPNYAAAETEAIAAYRAAIDQLAQAKQAAAQADARAAHDALHARYVGAPEWQGHDPAKRIAVLIANGNSMDVEATRELVASLNGLDLDASGSLLTPAFVSDGEVEKVIQGDPDAIARLGLGSECKYVLIGSLSRATAHQNPQFPDRYAASASAELRLVLAGSGQRVNGASVSEVASDYDTAGSIRAASKTLRGSIQRRAAKMLKKGE